VTTLFFAAGTTVHLSGAERGLPNAFFRQSNGPSNETVNADFATLATVVQSF